MISFVDIYGLCCEVTSGVHRDSSDAFFSFVGGGLGLFMGMFLGALDNPIMQEEMTTRQQIVFQAKQMGRRSWSSCKTFAVMGLVFSAAECTVEKVLLILIDDDLVVFCNCHFTIFLFTFRTNKIKLEIVLSIRIGYF